MKDVRREGKEGGKGMGREKDKEEKEEERERRKRKRRMRTWDRKKRKVSRKQE